MTEEEKNAKNFAKRSYKYWKKICKDTPNICTGVIVGLHCKEMLPEGKRQDACFKKIDQLQRKDKIIKFS